MVDKAVRPLDDRLKTMETTLKETKDEVHNLLRSMDSFNIKLDKIHEQHEALDKKVYFMKGFYGQKQKENVEYDESIE